MSNHTAARLTALNRSLLLLKSKKKIDSTLEKQINYIEKRIKSNDQIKLQRLRLSNEHLYKAKTVILEGKEYMVHYIANKIKALSILNNGNYDPILEVPSQLYFLIQKQLDSK